MKTATRTPKFRSILAISALGSMQMKRKQKYHDK